MMTQKLLNYLLLTFLIFVILSVNNFSKAEKQQNRSKIAEIIDSNKIAGFRASRILSSYPNNTFPEPEYWEQVGTQMAEKFNGFKSGGVWIVSIYLSDPLGYTLLNFPNPTSISYDSILFRSVDQNEDYLNHFDTTGISVWLQVEPSGADIDTLINLVLNKYKHHPCVKGFGVDVEWYQTYNHSGGRKVTDEEVERWEDNVKSIDSSYTLFLKHYSQNWMPPNYRGEILFIDDSQDFNWYSNPFNGMISEFTSWGNRYFPNPVGFQIGYPNDENWWGLFSDPAQTIGDELINAIPNLAGLYWVDFTVISTFPPTLIEMEEVLPQRFYLSQNYPNPFNPSTKINFGIDDKELITIKVFDILGNEILTLLNEEIYPGQYNIEFDVSSFNGNGGILPSGVLFYRMTAGNKSFTKKMIYLK